MLVHFEKEGILFLNQMLTTDGYPAIDLKRGGSITGLVTTIASLIRGFTPYPAKVEPIVPARGPLATLGDLQQYGAMLTTVQDRVRALRESGATLDDAIHAAPTRDFDERWGHGPVSPSQFVSMVFQSLK